MPTINELTAVTALAAGDQFPLYSSGAGDTQRAPLSVLADYMQNNLTLPSNSMTEQFAAPLTGTTVTVTLGNTWLLLSPAGTIAALTVVLPAGVDGQEVLVTSTQIITALTVVGIGAPTSMVANGFWRMKYNGVMSAWYRVG